MIAATPTATDDSPLVVRFERLKTDWKAQSQYLSNTMQMTMLRPYQQIISLGSPVIPLILQELAREPDHWFWALEVLTDENPVAAEEVGDLASATAAWLNWGRREGLLT